jgi:ethanolamine utilization cobalamin adenosyltransferase
MKFITETYLRNLYRIEPFASYNIEPDTRFTPEARQFLLDKGIKTAEDQIAAQKTTQKSMEVPVAAQKQKDYRAMKLRSKMRCVASLFLLTGEELLNRDVILAQKVIALGKQFRDIQKLVDGQGRACDLICEECTGIKNTNFSDDIGDCFEITEFHIQLEKGREIALLHHLRCALREIEPAVLEAYENSEEQGLLCESVIGKVNQIINTLCLMICLSVGGKKCQR